MTVFPTCPLCNSFDTYWYHEDRWRQYIKCGQCALIFVSHKYHLSAKKEKARYDLHNNDRNDPEYRSFLMQILDPLVEIVPVGNRGLDFGSGPEPVLTQMFRERGYAINCYDPYYANKTRVLEEIYDFLVCCETAEHFAKPREEWERFKKLVKPGGVIAIKTELMHENRDFTKWHYIRDETHLCFYSAVTIEQLCKILKLRIIIVTGATIILENM